MNTNVIAMTAEGHVGLDDPVYQAGMADLQAGRWQEAIDAFERLASRHPADPSVQQALREARFKAGLDANAHLTVTRWTKRWRPWLARTLALVLVAGAMVSGWQLIKYLTPKMAEARQESHRAQLVTEGNALLRAGDLDEAEERFRGVLIEDPDDRGALSGLAQLSEERELLALYAEGVGLQASGDHGAALEKLNQLSVRSPGYRDTSRRIAESERQLDLADIIAVAEADYLASRYEDAAAGYERVRQLAPQRQDETLTEHLADSYLQLGTELVQADPPAPDRLLEAIDYFKRALSLQPRNIAASSELRLAQLYIDGQALHRSGHWDEAIARLQAVYDEQPGYLGGLVIDLLYEAYVYSGDRFRAVGNFELALAQYEKATNLPVDDVTLSRARVSDVLTPTPTPSPTPAPTAELVAREPGADVRSGPGLGYARIGSLGPGAQAVIVGRYLGWWQIEYAEKLGWVFGEDVIASNTRSVPAVQPPRVRRSGGGRSTPFGATPTPIPSAPAADLRGLIVNSYWLWGAPGPFGVDQDIWFTFSITNGTGQLITFNSLGTWVEETGQFQKSFFFSDLAGGKTLVWRDHINIPEPGTYNLWFAIEFSDGIGVLMSGPIKVLIE